jgi:hypothetical protein
MVLTQKSKKKVASESESEEEKETKETPRSVKKPRIEDYPDSDSGSGAKAPVLKSADGEKYIELGKKKRVTARNFKGAALLDIREFWGSEGDEKPGKKGISLNLEQVRFCDTRHTSCLTDTTLYFQWEVLKNNIDVLDKLMKEQSKK